jgi:hypothetical protein
MFRTEPAPVSVRLDDSLWTVPEDPAVARQVDQIWSAEEGRHDGSVLSVSRISGDIVRVQQVDYRFVLAQIRTPDLASVLQISPLAVSGMTWIGPELVFGLRGQQLTQYPGHWELAPSGGVDAACIDPSGEVDYLRQLRTEFEEELGIDSMVIDGMKCIGLLHDAVSRLVEIGVEVHCTDSAASQLAASTPEYSELERVNPVDLSTWLGQRPILPLSVELLRYRELI